MTQDGERWNNLQLVDRGEDRLVICNYIRGAVPSNAVVLQMEPSPNLARFPGIFSNLTAHRSKVGVAYDLQTHRNSIEWHISPTYQQLKNDAPDLTKTKTLSTVMSGKRVRGGHNRRLGLLCYLCDHTEIDVYGYGHRKRWIAPDAPSAGREMGPLPARKKDKGLFPYQYTYAAENTHEPNYFTEKLIDAILSECLCFYWGCPNVYKWIDPRAFIPITAHDYSHSLHVIQAAIESNEWERRLPYIREAKQKILDELQIFPTLERLLDPSADHSSWP